MISPEKVIEALLNKLNTTDNKAALGINHAVQATEDLKEDEVMPPYVLVFEDFDQDGEIASDGTPIRTPVSISVVYVSTEFETVAEAIAKAFQSAFKLVQLCKGYYTLKNMNDEDEETLLQCKRKPFDILRKSKSITAIKINFTYQLDLIY